MALLKASEARGIARALWGEVNASYRTNAVGAFYYSCSGHGGFIISADLVNIQSWVENYVRKETAIRYIDRNGKSVLMHPYRTRSARLAYVKTETVEFYVFEEDCAWSVAVLLGFKLKKNSPTMEQARDTFWNWYDETNPVVKNRIEVEEKRKNKDPDLIVAASSVDWDAGTTKVWVADGEKYIVKGYDQCRDEYGTPYLSNTEILEHAA
jgi:hypothetical protein